MKEMANNCRKAESAYKWTKLVQGDSFFFHFAKMLKRKTNSSHREN